MANSRESLLYKHHLGMGETKVTKTFFEEMYKSTSNITSPDSLWAYGKLIPQSSDKIGEIVSLPNKGIYRVEVSENVWQDVVQRFIDVKLEPVDPITNNSFVLKIDGKIVTDVIPFNFYEAYYNYNLKTADGEKIYFGAGDWVFDTCSGLLTFYGDLPESVDHDHPPVLSFYRYIGRKGFVQDLDIMEAAVLPITNVISIPGKCVLTEDISSKITASANEVIPGFVKNFGWDGADDNTGIALSFEKLIPLFYSSTKDAVLAKNGQQVQTLLSSKHGTGNDAISVEFVSQKGTGTVVIQTGNGSKIAVNGNVYDLEEGVPTCVELLEGFMIVTRNATLTEGTIEVEITEDTDNVSAALLYWDPVFSEYKPFVNEEDVSFNLGYVMTAVIGKIPASYKLNGQIIGDTEDTITPEYYGPRTATFVVASKDSVNAKSSDVIVNKVLDNSLKDFKGNGLVVLRQGTYEIDTGWVIPDNTAIEGESSVVIDGGNIVIESNTVVTLRNLVLNSLTIPEGSIVSAINCKIDSVIVEEDGAFNAANTTLGTLTVNGKADVVGCTIAKLDIYSEEDVSVEACTVLRLEHKPNSILFTGTYVTEYSEFIPENEYPGTETFPIYLSKNHRIYTAIKNNIPVFYDAEANLIDFRIDTERLKIREDGTLTTILDTGMIEISGDYERQSGTDIPDPETKGIDEFKTLEEALKDLYWSKADLVHGQIPLKQLPDAVVYGGLLYVGNWCFDEHDGKYPTFNDITLDLTVEDHLKEMQPGWFFIVSAPEEELKDLSDNPARKQIAEDGKVFTAGDWCIFVGNKTFTPKINVTLADIDSQEEAEKALGYYLKDLPGSHITKVPDDATLPGLVGSMSTAFRTAYTYSAMYKDDDGTYYIGYINTSGVYALGFINGETGASITGGDSGIILREATTVVYSYDGEEELIPIFEKVDRAYQDAAYAILPARAPNGDAPSVPWTESGLLDLSQITIAQAFENINDELLHLQPRKPSNIKDIELVKDKTVDVKYRRTRETSLTDVYVAADANQNAAVVFHTKNEDIRSVYYIGKGGTVTVLNNGKEVLPVSLKLETDIDGKLDGWFVSHSYKDVSDLIPGFEHPRYYNAVTTSIAVAITDAGTIKAAIGVSDVADPFAEYNGVCPYASCTVVKPLTFDQLESQVLGVLTWNADNITAEYSKFKTSGRNKLGNKCTFNLDVSVSNIFNDFAPAENDFIKVVCKTTGEEKIIDKFKVKDYHNVEGSVSFDVDMEGKVVEGPIFELYVTDFYHTDWIKLDTVNVNQLMCDTLEDNRVFSGNALYPNKQSNLGEVWSRLYKPSNDLYELEGYPINVDDKWLLTYHWPKEADNGLIINDNFYRFVTFDTGVDVKDTNGYFINVETLEALTHSKLNGKTNDVFIQTFMMDEDGRNTPIFDCNEPVDGFTYALDTDADGVAVMYAGQSTPNVKRVSFGRSTFSGRVFVRVGIKKDTDIHIKSVKVEGVV